MQAAKESAKKLNNRSFSFFVKLLQNERCSLIESSAAAVVDTSQAAVPPATCTGNETSRATEGVGRMRKQNRKPKGDTQHRLGIVYVLFVSVPPVYYVAKYRTAPLRP